MLVFRLWISARVSGSNGSGVASDFDVGAVLQLCPKLPGSVQDKVRQHHYDMANPIIAQWFIVHWDKSALLRGMHAAISPQRVIDATCSRVRATALR